jgi:hypothetical protein
VNVTVVDVFREPTSSVIKEVTDLDTLRQYTTTNTQEGVTIRMFLVEDMTAPVVETLGRAFNCHPQLFEEHMHTIGYRRKTDFNEIGQARSLTFIASSAHTGKPILASGVQYNLHFSLPFRRSFLYDSKDDQERHRKARTMFRQYKEDEELLEERVSGVIYKMADIDLHIGECFISPRSIQSS